MMKDILHVTIGEFLLDSIIRYMDLALPASIHYRLCTVFGTYYTIAEFSVSATTLTYLL